MGVLGYYGYEDISIHPPREGWDNVARLLDAHGFEFQSTHPARGGTAINDRVQHEGEFQSTHPARGGTMSRACSTHMVLRFQSTHPARGGTMGG